MFVNKWPPFMFFQSMNICVTFHILRLLALVAKLRCSFNRTPLVFYIGFLLSSDPTKKALETLLKGVLVSRRSLTTPTQFHGQSGLVTSICVKQPLTKKTAVCWTKTSGILLRQKTLPPSWWESFWRWSMVRESLMKIKVISSWHIFPTLFLLPACRI